MYTKLKFQTLNMLRNILRYAYPLCILLPFPKICVGVGKHTLVSIILHVRLTKALQTIMREFSTKIDYPGIYSGSS